MNTEIERVKIGNFGLLLALFASAFAVARWFYSGKSEPYQLWFALGFLLFIPRAYAYRGLVPGVKLPIWTGVLASFGLVAMIYGLVLRGL
jgi:hypothetical protein